MLPMLLHRCVVNRYTSLPALAMCRSHCELLPVSPQSTPEQYTYFGLRETVLTLSATAKYACIEVRCETVR